MVTEQPNKRPYGQWLPARSGFSIIELLVVVVVTTIGFVALFELQAGSLRGMRNMRHMAEATNLAENFIERMRLEFSAWTPQSIAGLGDDAAFPRLAGLPTGNEAWAGAQTTSSVAIEGGPGWVIGSLDGEDRRVSVAGDLDESLGFNEGLHSALVDQGIAGEAQQPYCLLYRLTWLIPSQAFRVDVEVSWPQDHADMNSFVQCDVIAANRLDERRSITLTTTIATNLFRR